MPEIPHWYVVRAPENEEVYVALFNAIQQHGYTKRWRQGRPRKYLQLGDYKYWAMTTNLAVSRIINRDQQLD